MVSSNASAPQKEAAGKSTGSKNRQSPNAGARLSQGDPFGVSRTLQASVHVFAVKTKRCNRTAAEAVHPTCLEFHSFEVQNNYGV